MWLDRSDDGGGVDVEAILVRDVTDLVPDLPRHLGNVEELRCRDLPADVDQPQRDVCLARHARHGIVPQTLVKYRIGDLVTKLIGMPFGHGFGGEKHIFGIHGHDFFLLYG